MTGPYGRHQILRAQAHDRLGVSALMCQNTASGFQQLQRYF